MLGKPLDLDPRSVREVLSPLRNDFSVAVVGPGNAFAIGAIIRVAHNYLAREVIVVGDATWYPKGSMGMEKYETVRRFDALPAFFAAIQGRPLWAVEKDHARRSIHAVSAYPQDVVFVFGSERFGLPDEVLARADAVVGIPIYGVNQSLPLAVAAGIVMNDWARRRYADGATL